MAQPLIHLHHMLVMKARETDSLILRSAAKQGTAKPGYVSASTRETISMTS